MPGMLSRAVKRFSRSFTRCSRLGDGVGLLCAAVKRAAESRQTRETIRSGIVLRAFMGKSVEQFGNPKLLSSGNGC